MSTNQRLRSVLATPFYLGLQAVVLFDKLLRCALNARRHRGVCRAVGTVFCELILLVYPEWEEELMEKLARRSAR